MTWDKRPPVAGGWGKDPRNSLAVNYNAVIGLIVEAIKELSLKVEELS